MATTKKRKSKEISIPKLVQKAQKVFNQYIRERDSKDGYFTCISCFKTLPISQINAGHYVPVGKSSLLRFNPDNCHAECIRDNGFNDFHLIGYRKHLLLKIGEDKVKWLEDNQNKVYKWSRTELEEIIEHYSTLLKQKQ
jgi:hypothetical protein